MGTIFVDRFFMSQYLRIKFLTVLNTLPTSCVTTAHYELSLGKHFLENMGETNCIQKVNTDIVPELHAITRCVANGSPTAYTNLPNSISDQVWSDLSQCTQQDSDK